MKAISIKQPWLALIMSGEKTLEIRSWRTNVRGDVLLCASVAPKILDLPTGQALCIATIINCRQFLPDDAKKSCCDYSPGLFAWELSNIRPIAPFQVKGKLNFYQVELPPGLQIYDHQHIDQ